MPIKGSIPSEVHRSFGSELSAPAQSRLFVVAALRAWGCERALQDAALVTSELVANAVVHAIGPFELYVRCLEDCVRIEVTDSGGSPPLVKESDPLEPGGFGLVLVDAIADSWGFDDRSRGKTVWAELAVV